MAKTRNSIINFRLRVKSVFKASGVRVSGELKASGFRVSGVDALRLTPNLRLMPDYA